MTGWTSQELGTVMDANLRQFEQDDGIFALDVCFKLKDVRNPLTWSLL